MPKRNKTVYKLPYNSATTSFYLYQNERESDADPIIKIWLSKKGRRKPEMEISVRVTEKGIEKKEND